MRRLKTMCVMGTRPEAIKMAPIVHAARNFDRFIDTVVVSTAQHRGMLDDVLTTFDVRPDEDLDVMAPSQTLHEVASKVMAGMQRALARHQPDVVLVQGDTTTTLTAALAGYYAQCKVAHVEAGLRTGSKLAPFPEEGNRCMTSCVADLHFAPTPDARDNLLAEGYSWSSIFVTGNTVIDALLTTVEVVAGRPCPIPQLREPLASGRRMILITGHRRESFGGGLRRICEALLDVARRRPEICLVYPVHPNPNVVGAAEELLGGQDNIFLVEPQPYGDFVWLMQRSALIVTDSGGIQEEAPTLGKPVLVTRRVTERPEAVEAGAAQLVGDDPGEIIRHIERILSEPPNGRPTNGNGSLYGDGKSSQRIVATLLSELHEGWAGPTVVPLEASLPSAAAALGRERKRMPGRER